MSCLGCAERQKRIAAAAKAASAGNGRVALQNLSQAGRSLGQDARRIATTVRQSVSGVRNWVR